MPSHVQRVIVELLLNSTSKSSFPFFGANGKEEQMVLFSSQIYDKYISEHS